MRGSAGMRCSAATAFACACALAASSGLAGCKKQAAAPKPFGPTPVKTEVLQEENIPDTSVYLATLISRRSATINPQVEGWVIRIEAHSGERVRAGQPLMEIDPRVQEALLGSQIAARNAQAANLANAKAQYEREKKLYEVGIVSKQDYDTYRTTYQAAEAQTKSLEAQVKQQQEQLHYYTVTAPTDGMVGDIPVHVGDRVTNTTLLTTVNQMGALEAYIYVPVDHASKLRIGDPVDLLDGAGKVIGRSKVYFVSPQVDNATQTVLAKAPVANPDDRFRNEELVSVRITWQVTKGLEIPVLATQRINGQFFVFLAESGAKGTVARQQQIQVGNIIGNNYVVLSGLKAGEHLIVGGFQFLADGMPVKETVQKSSSQTAQADPH